MAIKKFTVFMQSGADETHKAKVNNKCFPNEYTRENMYKVYPVAFVLIQVGKKCQYQHWETCKELIVQWYCLKSCIQNWFLSSKPGMK